jgi:lipopolysaccharide export system permease protein
MTRILPRYISRQYMGLLVFSLLGSVLLFIVVDLVENADQFIDAKAAWHVVVMYYLYFLPNILVLTVPVGTLLATVFSVGILAKSNEITAMKALGYSFYQVMSVLLLLGFCVSIFSFFLEELIAIPSNQKMMEIKKQYLSKDEGATYLKYRNLLIQEPPDKIIEIEFYNNAQKTAYNVIIETFKGNQLVSRIDAAEMYWNGNKWSIKKGFQRLFTGEEERAFPILEPIEFKFQFSPKQLVSSQIKPDEMRFSELWGFIKKVRQSKGEVQRWLTDFHMRISFPVSNVFIVLLAAPLSYNRRKKSLAIGFGLCLLICFFFFGFIKLGETLGHNKSLHPILAAWLGNGVAALIGMINFTKTRK